MGTTRTVRSNTSMTLFTHADGGRGGMVFNAVCLSFLLHDIPRWVLNTHLLLARLHIV